ncbi:hypothetical protein ACWIYZ_04960 [Ursidibacter arcticus]
MTTKFLDRTEADGVTIIVNQGAKIETQISAKQGNVLTKENDGLAVVLPTNTGSNECCFKPTGYVVPNTQFHQTDSFTTELVEFITTNGDKFYVMREVKSNPDSVEEPSAPYPPEPEYPEAPEAPEIE